MAKHNQKPEITGFQLGGIVPLDAVGHVLKALYEGGAQGLQIQEFVEQLRPARRQMSDTDGVAGLLPAPSGPDPIQALIEIVSTAGPDGMKKARIAAALEAKNVSANILEGTPGQKLMKTGVLQRVGPGYYVLGPGALADAAPGAAPESPVQLPIPFEAEPKSKKDHMLRHLLTRGSAGASRAELWAVLKENGYPSGHFDPAPITELIEENLITRAVRGHYVAVAVANAAPTAESPKAVTEIRDGKKTIKSAVTAYLQQFAPGEARSKDDIARHVRKEMNKTEGSIITELSSMFKGGLLARPYPSHYSLPSPK